MPDQVSLTTVPSDAAALSGYYTYRSFLNRGEPVGDFNQIRVAEAELALRIGFDGVVSGTMAFPAAAASTRQSFLDLAGSVIPGPLPRLRFSGTGRAGSATAQHHYDYDCVLLPTETTADPGRRLALAGTVIQARDRETVKAGFAASFIATKRDFVEPRDVPGVALIPEAIVMLASRSHRLRQTVWHTLRDREYWWHPRMTEEDRRYFKMRGWCFDDPPRRPDHTFDSANGAGEDFLYMHRRMLRMLNAVYARAGLTPPAGWTVLPDPSTPQYVYREASGEPGSLTTYTYDSEQSGSMVPPATVEFLSQFDPPIRASLAALKTDEFFGTVMRNMERTLRNRLVAGQLTLGAYGNLIEFTLHNWMHMRWATMSRDPVDGSSRVRGVFDVDPKWDHARNDYLGDFYSAHVNPLFWKLHGWVDDCIDVWFQAHEAIHPGQVKEAVVRGISWFAQGPWVVKAEPFDWPGAGRHHHDAHGDDPAEIEALVSVLTRLQQITRRDADAGAAVSPSAASLLARRAAETVGDHDGAGAVRSGA